MLPRDLDVATRSVEMSALRTFRARVEWLDEASRRLTVSDTSSAIFMIGRYRAAFPEWRTRRDVLALASRAWDTAAQWADERVPEPLEPDVSAHRARYVEQITLEITRSLDRLPLYYVNDLLDEKVTTPPPSVTARNDGLLDAGAIARRAARRLAARVVTWTRSNAVRTVYGAYGITEFVWRTQRDRKVREAHRKLEGTSWPITTGAPGEGMPGEPYNCRCWAEPF